MPRLQVKSFDAPDVVRDAPLAHIESVNLDEAQVGRCRFEPGWRWSEAFGPLLGVTSCPMRHFGYTLSGSLHVEMDDGRSLDIREGDVFDIPPGHDKWVVGDEAWTTIEWGGSGRAMGEALGEGRDRALATVLFSDIVDSTLRLGELGDAAWRDHLAHHNARMREQLNVYRGREVKTTGDGFLAVFDSPSRAVRCAVAMVAAARRIDTSLRVAVHTGEVEHAGEDVRGIAVHVAARVLAIVGSDAVVVTETTAGLIEGSGITLEDAGTHDLKGVSGSRRVFRVVSSG
jgi:class 3 adenylate cyclase